jgi:PAS domain S-box-containing protein
VPTEGDPRVVAALHQTLEHTTDAFMALDPEWRITFLNAHAAETLGGSRESLMGRVLWDAVPSGHGTLAHREYERAMRERTPVHFEHGRASDGRWFEIHAYPTPEGLSVFFRDVTERHQREEQLRLRAQQVELALRSSGVVLFAQDRDLRYLWIRNPSLGRAADQIVGRTDRDVFEHPDDAAALEAMKRRVLDTGQPLRRELPIRSGGRTLTYDVTVEPLRGEDGAITGVACAALDVTERLAREHELREHQKLESVGILAAGIAHDFNNLLTGVLGNTALALRSLPPETAPRIRPLLEDVVRAGERAAELTRLLLAYAGKGRFVFERTDLCRVVGELVGELRAIVPAAVTLRFDATEHCPPVEVDRSQLRELLRIFVVNAVEALGQAGGTITVRVDVVGLDAPWRPDFATDQLAPGRYTLLEVADTGPGIAPEHLRGIFDPFFTTKFFGRGLGLAAAQGIARAHGGAVAVDSELGAGATFRVWLPIVTEAAMLDAGPAAPRAGTPETAPRGRVLVVDDEAGVRAVAAAALEEEGWEVVEAEHGEAALDAVRARPDGFRLVLLDLTMPGTSGAEVARRVAELAPALPVLVTSGYGDVEAARQLGGVAVAGFLPKPFDVDRLLAAAERITGAG